MSAGIAFDDTPEGADRLDREDPLAGFAERFDRPEGVSYLCGHCLGLPPKTARRHLDEILSAWQSRGFRGHFTAPDEWLSYEARYLTEPMAAIVGAAPAETALMNGLSVNLHAMLVSFFRPVTGRNKILMEEGAFPSDQHVVDSQLRLHGLSPEEAIVRVPRSRETGLLERDALVDVIDRSGGEVALVLLGSPCFRTGQVLDLGAVTSAARRKGCLVGFDLAHAAGNVELRLHDWDIDFAVWCTYKYLNGGPGGVGGCFVHERHARSAGLHRLAGWWGNELASRFPGERRPIFTPVDGARGWQTSSPPILSMAVLRASLEIFHDAGMARLRDKSVRLGDYLRFLLDGLDAKAPGAWTSLTPRSAGERGCQLTLRGHTDSKTVQAWLLARGVVCDAQGRDTIRVAPVPLYNSYSDVHRFVSGLTEFSVAR